MDIKLNIGCGNDIKKGYINIDLFERPGVDVVCNADKLPYDDCSISEIYTSHLIEHFPPYETKNILLEWIRVLRSGGKLIIIYPDGEKTCRQWLKASSNRRHRLNHNFVGTPWENGNQHQWVWWEDEIEKILKELGLINISSTPATNMPDIINECTETIAYKPNIIEYSIIIPVYNQLEWTKKCINSIRKFTRENYELIVVSNGSNNETNSWLSEQDIDNFMIFENPLGYAGANNKAIRKAKGNYIILLNSDIELYDYNWISLMRDEFDKDASIGIVGPSLKYCNHINRDFIIFFCVMIKREVFDKIGLLDEDFGVGGGEDTYFSIKAVDAGFKLAQAGEKIGVEDKYVVGNFPIYHEGEATMHGEIGIGKWNEIFKQNSELLKKKYKERNKMNILVTNVYLNDPRGSEIWTKTIIQALKIIGHNVDVFSPSYGEFYYKEMSDITSMSVNTIKNKHYDLVIMNHPTSILPYMKHTMWDKIAIVCHGTTHPAETPIKIPNAIYLCISEEIKEYYKDKFDFRVLKQPISQEWFDISDCNEKLTKVLWAYHYGSSEPDYGPLQEVLDERGIILDKIGFPNDPNQSIIWPDDVRKHYEAAQMVIGQGRWIYQAIAAGRSAVVMNKKLLGIVTADNYESFKWYNMTDRNPDAYIPDKNAWNKIIDKWDVHYKIKNIALQHNALTVANEILTLCENIQLSKLKNSLELTVIIPTRNRYDFLSHTLAGLVRQTYNNFSIIIIDDTDKPQDIREIPLLAHQLKMLDNKNIPWEVVFGKKIGPQWSHQTGLELAKSELIYRIDDDEYPEPNTLKILVEKFNDPLVGAASGLVINPTAIKLPDNLEYLSKSLGENTNIQHFLQTPRIIDDAQHLTSSFIYRKSAAEKIGGYFTDYSHVGHREETDFTYRLYNAGYKLIIDTSVIIRHYQSPSGGIRSNNPNSNLWEQDNNKFWSRIITMSKNDNNKIFIPIFAGIGDHLAITPMLRALRKSTDKKIIVGASIDCVLHNNPNIDAFWPLDIIKDISTHPYNVYEKGFKSKSNKKLRTMWCEEYNVEDDGKPLDMYISEYRKNKANDFTNKIDNKIILISPFSANMNNNKQSTYKDWEITKWKKLIQKLINKGYYVCQLGIEGEEDLGANIFFKEHLLDALALIEQADLIISVDTWTGHAANALNTPAIILWGETNPQIYGYDSNINIEKTGHNSNVQWLINENINNDKMKLIAIDDVLNKVDMLDGNL